LKEKEETSQNRATKQESSSTSPRYKTKLMVKGFK